MQYKHDNSWFDNLLLKKFYLLNPDEIMFEIMLHENFKNQKDKSTVIKTYKWIIYNLKKNIKMNDI